MNKADITKEVERFQIFLNWQRVARVEYRPKFWQRFFGSMSYCECIITPWAPDELAICNQHSEKFGIVAKHFMGIPISVLEQQLSSEEGKKQLIQRVYRRQNVSLKSGITLAELQKTAKEHFEETPIEELKLVVGSSAILESESGYCYGTSNWLYLTIGDD